MNPIYTACFEYVENWGSYGRVQGRVIDEMICAGAVARYWLRGRYPVGIQFSIYPDQEDCPGRRFQLLPCSQILDIETGVDHGIFSEMAQLLEDLEFAVGDVARVVVESV